MGGNYNIDTRRTMPQEDLTLTLRGRGICARLGLTYFKASLNIDLAAGFQSLEVFVWARIEGDHTVPSSVTRSL